jgi:hypothetical protein
MTLDELLEKMRDGHVDVWKDIPDQRAKAIMLKLFRQVSTAVGNATEERVQVPGLGVFRIRKVEKARDGKKVVRRQVRFLPAGEMQRMAKRAGRGAT